MTVGKLNAKPLALPVKSINGIPPCLVGVRGDLANLTSVFGPPHLTCWEDGLGDCDAWGFAFECGLEIVVMRLHYCPPDGEQGANILADLPEIAHVRRHLPLSPDRFENIPPQFLQTELQQLVKVQPEKAAMIAALHDFQVWCVDDNGNVFAVGDPTSERDAKCWCAELESHAHKQMYYYRPVNSA